MKESKIEVPEGYEIDKENSTFECIKFKKKREIKTWDDLCEAGAISDEIRLTGYYIGEDSNICMVHRLLVKNQNRNVFLTEKEAKRARAAAMISQLMPYYGGAITSNSWNDACVNKFTIKRIGGLVKFGVTMTEYSFLAFKTYEYRESFYNNNEQLVEGYLMID